MKKVLLLFVFIIKCFSEVIITKFSEDDDYNFAKFDKSKENYNVNFNNNPDNYLDTAQIIRRHGYRSESHIVQTEDGYLLTIHRIPANKNGRPGNQPVLFQHGLLSSSADWVITGNKSLAFILSDLEYDVWLGNARGNTYSKAHVSLSPESNQFWNFSKLNTNIGVKLLDSTFKQYAQVNLKINLVSFHEVAIYDLPAVVSYIQNVTNKQGEIIYIGHSMGTTSFFAFSSLLPEFARSSIKIMVGLAPVAFTTHIQSPLRYLAPWADDYQWIANHLGIKQFLPNDEIMKLLSLGCEMLDVHKTICKQVIFAICGFDAEQFDENLLPAILAHDPAGSSTKTIIHFAQLIRHGGYFVQYDYGEAGNLIKYGTRVPPQYNLSNIEVPTYFMYGDNDWLCGASDVQRLSAIVTKSVGIYEVPFKKFNHVDFIWAKDAPELVYKKLIKTIK